MTTDESHDEILHEGEIEAQRRYNVVRKGREMSRIFRETLSPALIQKIEAQSFFFIATANHRGECDCSFRGRQLSNLPNPEPAIKVIDDKTLIFPDYSGNNLYNSLGNIIVNPNIGMLFIDFQRVLRVRVNGHAEIIEDRTVFEELWPDALRCVKVTVVQAYPNCKTNVPRMIMEW